MNIPTAAKSGQVLMVNNQGNPKWVDYPFVAEFDDAWANNYALKCERMCEKFATKTGGASGDYGSVYKLCEVLWKLKVWKPY